MLAFCRVTGLQRTSERPASLSTSIHRSERFTRNGSWHLRCTYEPHHNCLTKDPSTAAHEVLPEPPGCLLAGSSPAEAARRVSVFLARRRWLRPTPDAPLQLVRATASAPSPPPQPPGLVHGQRPPQPPSPQPTPYLQAVVGSGQHDGVSQTPNCASRASDIGSPVDSHGSGQGSSTALFSSTITAPCSFYIIRDDLLHPVLGGNKIRKLDALVPELVSQGATHVLTCGGVQSAHTAAVAVAAVEAGLRSVLLVRGEKPQVPTGYHLVTRMYGSEVSYVSRAEYADRAAMLASRAEDLRCREPGAQVAVVAEGGGDAPALLGLIRLVHWLAGGSGDARGEGSSGSSGSGESHHGTQGAAESSASSSATVTALDKGERRSGGRGLADRSPGPCVAAGGLPPGARRVTAVQGLPYAAATPHKFVVDAGTGTTAIGLALAISLLGLPWSVAAVMLGGDLPYYRAQQEQLLRSFLERYGQELYRGDADGGAATSGGGLSGGGDGTAQSHGVAAASEAPGGTAHGAAAEAGGSGAGGAGGAASAEADCREAASASASVWAARAAAQLPLQWLPRGVPRRFGKVLPGEIEACKQVAREYGIGLDPIYSLAAWELSCKEAAADAAAAAASAANARGNAARDGAAHVPATYPHDAADTSAAGSAADSVAAGSSACGASERVAADSCGGGAGSLLQANTADEVELALGDGCQVVDVTPESTEDASRMPVGCGGREGAIDPWVGPDGSLAPARPRVVMLHGGGEMGLHGLAQRYPDAF